MRRQRTSRRILALVAGFLALAAAAAACNDATLTQAPPCSGDQCSCEADPSQPRCRAYNERPDGLTYPDERIDADLPDNAVADSAADASNDAHDGAD